MKNSILIADLSEIISSGIKSMLLELDKNLYIKELKSWGNLEKFVQKENVSVVVFNVNVLPESAFSIINSNVGRMKRIRFIAYSTYEIPDQIKAQCPAHFKLNDSKENILAVFESILLTRKHKRKRHGSSHLSRREEAVVRCIALGMTNKEIADELFISAHTVIAHRKNITRKLAIKTVSGLTVYAILNKLVKFEEIE